MGNYLDMAYRIQRFWENIPTLSLNLDHFSDGMAHHRRVVQGPSERQKSDGFFLFIHFLL